MQQKEEDNKDLQQASQSTKLSEQKPTLFSTHTLEIFDRRKSESFN